MLRGVYRPSTSKPNGAWSRHLDEQRRLRDLSQTQAFELVYERVGWSPKSRTAYVAIDKGERQPKPHEAAVLADEFGWPTESGEPVTVAPPDDLAAAIRALTAELRDAREEREALRVERASVLARLDRLDAILDVLAPPTMRGEGGPVARRETTESAQ